VTTRAKDKTKPLVNAASSGMPLEGSAELARERRHAAVVGLAPYAIAVASTVWFFRGTFITRRMPGDTGDARWTVAIYEHWFQVWQGDEALRTLSFFFPTANTLGMSDAYVAHGQLHSIARALGLDHVAAWAASTIGVYFVGALGLAFLSSLVLRSTLFRCAFVALSSLSYPITVMIGHPQLAGFLSLSWLFAGAVLLFCHGSKLGVYLLILVTPLLVLSSWYAAILGWLTLVATAAFLAILTPSALLRASLSRFQTGVRASVARWYGLVAWAGSAALWALAVWIYLPARHISPTTDWVEVVSFSPRLSDLLNASAHGGGVWAHVYNAVYAGPFNGERELGFTPLLLSAMLFAGGAGLRRLAVESTGGLSARSRTRLSSAAVCVVGVSTVLGLAMITVVDDAGHSAFRLLWELVPGFDAIRAPFRIQLVLYPFAIFVVLTALEAWTIQRSHDGKQHNAVLFRISRAGLLGRWIVAGLLSVGILAEMQREPALHWGAADLVSPDLVAQIPTIRESCGAIVVDIEGRMYAAPARDRALDAVMLSMLSDVPTPDGYSRSAPIGHPGIGESPAALIGWMREEGYDGNLCAVSPNELTIVAATA
jgi:hypothetical protein